MVKTLDIVFALVSGYAHVFTMMLIRAEFDTLESRRDQLTERYFQRNILPETSCSHYLPHPINCETLKSRTVKFKIHSFNNYALILNF